MSLIKKKRNVWKTEEVKFFLNLIKERQILKIMNGKRLRIQEIFEALLEPMASAGFTTRDNVQLQVKWKNLKGDYYRSQRHNSVTGNEPYYCDFYEEIGEILENRFNSILEGFDTLPEASQLEETRSPESQSFYTEEKPVINHDNQEVKRAPVEAVYLKQPDFDRQKPCTSAQTPHRTASTSKYRTKPVGGDNLPKFRKQIEATLEKFRLETVKSEQIFMKEFFAHSERLMRQSNKILLAGLKEIFAPTTPSLNHNSSSSDSEN